MHRLKISKLFAAMLAFVLTTGIFLSPAADSVAITAYADAAAAASDRDHEGKKNASDDVDFWNDINIDQSFAYQIRMATNYANRMAANNVPIGGKSNTYQSKLEFNNVAPFFGYTSGEINTDIVYSPSQTRGGNTSASSVSYSRALLRSYNGVSGNGKAISWYGDYGLLLNLMGFDSVGSAAENSRRSLFGIIALGSYYAAGSVNTLFEIMFNVLESTNPFQFFRDINISSDAGKNELQSISEGAIDASEETGGALNTVTTYFGKIFNAFADFSWAVAIPLSLVFIIVAVFLTRNGRYKFASNMKKFFVRIVFLIVGIPILGSAYTQVLDALKASRVMSDDYITQAVSYTFLDFGEWVENRRLAPLDGHTRAKSPFCIGTVNGTKDGLEGGDSYVAAATWFSIRELCSDLNEANGVFDLGTNKYLSLNSDTGALLKDYMYETTGATMATSDTSATLSAVDMKNKEAIVSVITKYMHGTKYTPEMFETGTVANMIKLGSGSTGTSYGDMLALSCDKYSFSQNAERTIRGLQGKVNSGGIEYDPENPDKASPYSKVAKARFNGTDFAGVGYNIWNNGGMKAEAWDPAAGYAGLPSSGTEVIIDKTVDSDGKDLGLDPKQTMGFSTMSMYTYLTTQFTQDGLIVYGDAPSDYTQTCHYAVNLIGGSYIMQVAFFANMVTLLLSYFIMAIVFVFRAAFDILFKGIHLLGHALLAAVGFYKSIGTAICMTINMITQLFVSVIFFSLVTDVMFIMTSLGNHFFNKLVRSAGNIIVTKSSWSAVSADSSFQAEILVITSTLLSSLIIVFFVFFAIRWRAAIMNTINSTVESIVGTLLGVQLSGASDAGTSAMFKGALNDTLNVAGVAATTAGAMGLVSETAKMGEDIMDSAAADIGDGEVPVRGLQGDMFGTDTKSAVDAAADTTVGAAFNGGKGKDEADAEITKEETEELLKDGLPDKHGSTGGHEYGGGGGSGSRDESSDEEKTETKEQRDYNDVGYYHGGSADGTIAAADNVTVDEDGNVILNRNGTGSDAEAESSDDSGLVVGLDTKGGVIPGTSSSDSQTETADETTETATKKETASAATTSTDTAELTETAVKENNVTSSVGEDEQGTFWTQINPDTGTETSARFDMARGLVIGMTDENGNVSDVAIGMNGISTSTVDANGNKQVTQLNEDGIQSTYTGVDGTTETVTANVDGADSSVKINRTDANGNTEEIVTDMNGTTKTRTEQSADGSTKTLVTDDEGNQTITEKNAVTGYESTETISASGESVKTESINGVTTVTKTDEEGNLVAQDVTKLDANGNAVTTSYSIDDEGNTISSVTSNGVTDKTITAEDGSKTEIQSVIRSDGTVVETTTEYGTDAIADSTNTVVKSASGEVIGTGTVTTGTDDVGAYTSSTITTDKGTTEVKDYGNGHVITTESVGGVDSVTEIKDDGSRIITETDTTTGEVRTATIGANGKGEVVLKNSEGEVISEEKITADSSGTSTYTMMNGGTVTYSTIGEGADKEHVVAQTYATGGQDIISTNAKTDNQTITSTDGLGSQTIRTVDAKTGDVTTEYRHASGNAGVSILDSDGNYQEHVTLAGGGTKTVVRTGTGDDAVETITKIDGAGNTMYQQSTGGQIDRIEATSGNNTSFVQMRGEDGSVITQQVLESGATIRKVQQANGDYTQETINANGSATYVESKDGVETVRNVSLTGIETTALKQGSASTETMNLAGITFLSSMNGQGDNMMSFRTSTGQTYTMMNDASGDSKTFFESGDGNTISYKQNPDNSVDYIVRNANGTSRVENVSQTGESKVVYYDADNNVIDAPQGADSYNDVMAAAMKSFKTQNPSLVIPNFVMSQAAVMPNFNAETQGNLNLGGTPTFDMGSFSASGNITGTFNPNVAYNMQMTGNPDDSTFVPMTDMSMMPDMSDMTNPLGTDNVKDVDAESTTTFNVHKKTKSKTSFLENLFSGLVAGDESEDSDTSASEEAATGTQRTLENLASMMKLHRNTGAGMGDYATRKGGSASDDDKK